MLQQTQVKTVLPYWERWMAELPDIQALAAASLDRIHKLWEGLGYYTRVRNMHRAARIIMEEHAGSFPKQFEDVLALPGIGRYTAGAICSIAYNQPTPVLDGNVVRVLTRVFGISGNPRQKEVNKKLWDLAAHFVGAAARLTGRQAAKIRASNSSPSENREQAPRFCSSLNQAVMELGALICTPRRPKCEICPLSQYCVALIERRVEALPNIGPRAPSTARRFIAFVAERNGRCLVRQRPAGVVNGHLWEFPNVELRNGDKNFRRAARNELGVNLKTLEPVSVIKHTITRYRITVEVFRITPVKGDRINGGQWLAPLELLKLSFSSAHKQILHQVVCGL